MCSAGGLSELAFCLTHTLAFKPRTEVHYIRFRINDNRLVQLHPLAASQKNCKGEEMTDMIDLSYRWSCCLYRWAQAFMAHGIFFENTPVLTKFDGVLIDHPKTFG